MRNFLKRYLNEIVSLSVMLLMIVALIHAETVVGAASGAAQTQEFRTVTREPVSIP